MKQATDERTKTDQTYHLTNSQRLIWTGQQLSPGQPVYNMALAFELLGVIDTRRFQQAFRILIEQCDAMRTVFVPREDQAVQRILDDLPYTLEVIDWTETAPPGISLDDWLQHRSQQIFELSECLFDSVLIKLAEDHYLWYLNQHHLITDAWATSVQYQAMADLYRTIDAGPGSPEVDLPRFADHLLAASNSNGTAQQTALREHWQLKLNEPISVPEFYGRQATRPASGSQRISLPLGRNRSTALRQLTHEADLRAWTTHLSLFNIFSTVLFAYLHRVSGQEKIVIGAPAHNRVTAQQKQTPGLFIEVFPISTNVIPEDTFLSLFEKVREENHLFLKYAQAGSSTAELSRTYQVVLNYITAAFADFNEIQMRSNWIHPGHADPYHYLRLQVQDFDATGEIHLHFDLNTTIFDERLRQEAPIHFLRLLDGFIADRTQPIGRPALTTGDGAITGNTVGSEQTSVTVLDLFAEQVSRNEAAPAIQYDQHSWSYQQVDEQANQLARFLLDHGLQKGDRIGIHLPRSPEFLISVIAVLKAGGVFVPVPVHYPSGRVLGILNDADARLVLSTSGQAAALAASTAPVIRLDVEQAFISRQASTAPAQTIRPGDLAYLLYTSGSTGTPKGVMISHAALAYYIDWARRTYKTDEAPVMPLFTSIGFDLTITSIFLPLAAGGTIIPYPESERPPDLALFQVIEDDRVNMIKLTPAHLGLLQGHATGVSSVQTLIVGGENFSTQSAQAALEQFGTSVAIYNEYGPTEATVGCVVHRYDPAQDQQASVPIGQPIDGTTVYLLDPFGHPVPDGTSGELHISGPGLAEGYWQQPDLSHKKFIPHPQNPAVRLYRSGDLVRRNPSGQLEFLGRQDDQVKIGGRRVEPAEIAGAITSYPGIRQAIVVMRERMRRITSEARHNCTRCGLPSNYPNAKFDDQGICQLCRSFQSYQDKVSRYFRNMDDLRELFAAQPGRAERQYDCLALLSGGKDSTYALAKLVEMGQKVLAFTLDNGYISEQAKDNIRRVVDELGVDHVFGETPAMNDIFVDSLQRHCNVCDGCFKTIYTLSIQLALEKHIPYIVTGLSRGQFFETRLTEELFRKPDFDPDEIDAIILEARKAYHQVDDAVRELLDVSMFRDEEVFEKVQFIDFYRYTDVSLDEMLDYLDKRLPWVRPTDTGRSTNCLINQAGIYVHKKEKGYSNYAFPYSWDVRVGHKTRDASLEEINEAIDEQEVRRILDEIGYTRAQQERPDSEQLIAYYTADTEASVQALRAHLLIRFPEYMVPVQFIRLKEIPLTLNGKVDIDALPMPDISRGDMAVDYLAPRTDIELIIAEIWEDLLEIDRVGVLDNFIEAGGDSLAGIRVMARINEAFELELPINLIFEKTNVAAIAQHIEETITRLLAELERSE